jgi:hypothetical protein
MWRANALREVVKGVFLQSVPYPSSKVNYELGSRFNYDLVSGCHLYMDLYRL